MPPPRHASDAASEPSARSAARPACPGRMPPRPTPDRRRARRSGFWTDISLLSPCGVLVLVYKKSGRRLCAERDQVRSRHQVAGLLVAQRKFEIAFGETGVLAHQGFG